MDTLLLVALAVVALYVVACVIWPWTACRRCSGSGKLRSPSGKNWRACPRCDGSGKRVRFGRVLYGLLVREDD